MVAQDPAKQELVKVYTAADEMEARMIQELLENAGIESMLNAKVAPGLFPSTWGDLARQDILVFAPRAEEARKIVAEHCQGDEPG
jgi:hypothetical protein